MVRRFGFSAVVFLVGGVLTLLFSGVLSAASYADPQGRFSFTAPDTWQQTPAPTGVTLPPGVQFAVAYAVPALKANGFQANANIVTATLPGTAAPLADVVSGAVAQIAQTPGYVAGAGGVTDLTLGGRPAKMFQYSLPSGSQTTRLEQVVTLNGTTAYIITFASDPADFAALMQQAGTVLSSFSFAAASAAPATGPTTATGSAPAPVVPVPTATRPTTVAPAPPRTGEGGGADYVRRLGDG